MDGLGRFGVGSGGSWGAIVARNQFVFTLQGLPFAVKCGLKRNGTQCQPNKRYRSKCIEFYRSDRTDDLDHLR
jgi:hypothetical protein